MLEALERVEQTFKEKEINRDTEESSTLYPAYLKDENFLAEMKSHYGIFQKLFLSSFKKLNKYIRSHETEFVEIIEG